MCVHIQSSIHLFAYSTHKITLELCVDKWFIIVASLKTGYSGTGVVRWFLKNINPLVPMGFCAMWMHWFLRSQFWIFKKEFETEPRKTCKLFRTHHCWGDCTNSVCLVQFSSLNRTQLFAVPWTAACQASLSTTSSFGGTCSNSCPLSQWCHPTISSSVYVV